MDKATLGMSWNHFHSIHILICILIGNSNTLFSDFLSDMGLIKIVLRKLYVSTFCSIIKRQTSLNLWRTCYMRRKIRKSDVSISQIRKSDVCLAKNPTPQHTDGSENPTILCMISENPMWNYPKSDDPISPGPPPISVGFSGDF